MILGFAELETVERHSWRFSYRNPLNTNQAFFHRFNRAESHVHLPVCLELSGALKRVLPIRRDLQSSIRPIA
jgi:hypothetical protein